MRILPLASALALAAAASTPSLAQLFTFDSGVAGWSVYNIGLNGWPLDDPPPVGQPSHDPSLACHREAFAWVMPRRRLGSA